MRSLIFGLMASGLTAYNPTGDPIIILALMILSMSLLSFYFAYRSGYLKGKGELLEKMNEVIELVNEANAVARGIDAAFGDIKSLEILQEKGEDA